MTHVDMAETGRGTGTTHAAAPAESRAAYWRRRLREGLGPGTWRRGLVVAALALLDGIVMLGHAAIPNRVGNLGSLVETFLPWFGLAVPVLLVCALWRRSLTAMCALVLPVFVWFNLFGGLLTDKSGGGGDLTAVSHNVAEENTDAAGTARKLVESDADVLALQEVTQDNRAAYEDGLAEAYPYHEVAGTVGVWSKYPLSDTRPVDIHMGWTRALRTTVATDAGPLALYTAHLPSVRVKLDAGFTANQRDLSADALGEAIKDEPVDRVLLLGDLNGTMNDRALANVTSQLRSAQGASGSGFGFSWPAGFPTARIDQILLRGVQPVSSDVLGETGSDHRPVRASVDL
ncbi:endonuclease/exonuclease/phosphatase family protein [Streptomyces sp. WMMC500]|uniref:endonuclease/exonuclease/phosphatase family protein n=1 Tax=Streptomyces sp. WMMC500 TaxID=3015154 RepID=UPI00248C0BC3|nr:endonuclease/exonuclease/phosphatase family protein [Streptomyces sp. WMMC500]WBB59767.1 endonuclease/exonuclease/phosphatase family protein [Streptomyces sp. WMMC500]